MIGKLTGIIDQAKNTPLIIDVRDVGYVVHVPLSYLKNIKIGKPHTFFIHSHIREDAFDLYGFLTTQELALFELLITVSGVGPKTALLVMDHGVNAIETAVRKSDVDFFTSIPRLGTKNAQKIIIELKSKLGSSKMLDLSDTSSETKEAMDALASMGFEKTEIREAFKKLDEKDTTLEQKIRHVLKILRR